MPAKLRELVLDIDQVKKIAQDARVSVTELANAIDLLAKQGTQLKGIQIFGATDQELRNIYNQIPEIGKAYIQSVAEIQRAHQGEKTSIDITKASYDAYTKQLRVTAQVRRELEIGVGEKAYKLPIIATLPEMIIPMEAGQRFNAVQTEMIERLGGGATGMERAETIAKKYGFTMNDLTRAHTDAVNGVTRFSFAMDHGGGVTRDASVHIDRLGNVLSDTSTRFRNTTAMIERNLGKVMEWAVAVGVVYGVIRKLGEVMDDMKEMQVSFADIAIVMDESTDSAYKYITAIEGIATVTGTTFRDILNVYDEVLRATANISDETERMAVANRLLTDSAILARLANIDTVASYDMLLGALRQAGMELDQGIILLDKWVAVSKNAGVTVKDMAQSFAITADIADAAGVNIDKLNGLIATLTESTTLSSTEVGNALRAMMSTYTSERSMAVLNQYGIAVQDLSGNYRDLWSVMQQISAMYETGVLSASQMKAIADAMGGGQRRAAQVMTIISNLDKAQESAAISANAHGDAEAALAIKMDTLQTATNALTAAWQTFAITLGTEGGVLDMMTNLTSTMAKFVGVLTDTTEALGPLTSSLIQLAVVYAAFSFASGTQLMGGLGMGLAGMFGKVAGTIIPAGGLLPGYGTRETTRGMQYIKLGTEGQAFPGSAAQIASQQQAVAQQATFIAATGQMGSAVTWLKDPRNLVGVFSVAAIAAAPLLTEGFTEGAVMRTAGSALGAAAGWAITSSPIGGIIGAQIVQVILSAMQKEAELRTAPLEELTDKQLAERLEIQKRYLTAAAAGVGKRETYMADIQAAETKAALQADIAAIEAAMAARKAAVSKELDIEVNLYDQMMREVKDIQIAHVGEIPTIEETILEGLEKFAAGKITRKAYTDLVKGAEESAAIIGQLWYHMADDVGKSFSEVYDIVAGASAETRDQILASTAELTSLDIQRQTILEQLNSSEYISLQQASALNEEAKKANEEYEKRLDIIKLLLELGEREAGPPVPQFAKYDISTAELEEYIKVAQQMMREFAAFTGIEIGQLWEEAAYYAFTNDDNWNKIGEEVNKQFLQMAITAGETFSSHFNLERLQDVGPEKWGEIVQKTRYWEEFFRRIGKPVEQEPVTFLLGNQNEVRTIVADLDAIRYTLSDIRELEEKQMLEGMWNIPAGATFYVPISSLFYQRMQDTGVGAGGIPELPPYGSGAGMVGSGLGVATSEVGDLGNSARTTGQVFTEITAAMRVEMDKLMALPTEHWQKLWESKKSIPDMLAEWESKIQYTPVTSEMKAEMAKSLAQPAEYWSKLWESGKSLSEMAQEIKVEIPPTNVRVEIENKVMLDGRVLAYYMTEYMAESLRSSSRAGQSPAAANSPRMRRLI